MDSPWRAEGEWLRAALHAHSTNSDGELSARGVAQHYGRAGYDVVALTDHWHRSEAPSTAGLLVLPGVELNCLLPEDRDGHVLGIGIEQDPAELEGERRGLAETAEWIVGAGGVAYLAHPYWTGVRPAGFELPASVAGIEVFNAGCELEVGRGLSSVHWDELLQDGRSCPALVTERQPPPRLSTPITRAGHNTAVLEELVPVHGREPAADLELAPGVEYLDPGDREAGRSNPAGRAPVQYGMREVGDPSLTDDPLARLGEVAALPLELRGIAFDPDAEHVPVAALGQDAVELDAWKDEQSPAADGSHASVPMVSERDDVVAGPGVVTHDVSWRRARRPSSSCGCAARHATTLRGVSTASPRPETLFAEPPVYRVRSRDGTTTRGSARGGFPRAGVRVPSKAGGRNGSTGASCSSGASPPRPASPSWRCPKPPLPRGKGARGPADPGNEEEPRPLVAAAKKEGHLNVIALPPDWANYGEIISTFTKKYGIGITSDNPQGSSADENQAIVSLKGDPRAPDVVDVNPTFAVAGTVSGLYTRYYVTNYATVPRSMKDTRGLWTGDYYGSVTIGYNANVVKTPPKSFADLLKPIYKNQVALNGSPLNSGSAIAGVFAAALANGGSLSNVGPGVDWFAKARSAGNYIPVETTPQTVASGQTPISIDWDYNNFAYVKEFPSANWKVVIPSDGQYGGYYCQAVSATAPHPWAARLWQEFLFSDQGRSSPEGLRAPRALRRPCRAQGDPEVGDGSLPAAWLNSKGAKFASLGQQAKAKVVINTEWPAKLGSS